MAKAGGIGKLAGKSFVLRVIAAGMTYAFVVVMARIMDVKDFGIVGMIMSGSLFFSVVGCFGQRMALLRFVPPELEKNPDNPPTPLIATVFRLALSGNVVIFLLLAAGAVIGQMIGRFDNAALIIFGLLIVPLTGMIDMQAHLARAYRSIVLAITPKDILWRLLSLAVLVPVFFLSGENIPLWIAFATLSGVLVLLIAGQGMFMQKRLGVPGFLRGALFEKTNYADPAWKAARVPLWIASIAAIAFTNLDVVIAGVLIGPKVAAFYFAANRIALVPGFFLTSYNIVVGPMFSEHHAAGRATQMQIVARNASLQVFLPTLAVVAVLIVGAGPILSLFGPEFSSAANTLRILLVAALANASFGPNELILTMCGREREAMYMALFSTVAGAGFMLAGGFTGSPEGLALGTLAAILTARFLGWIVVRRTLGFSADAFTSVIFKFGRAKN